MAVRQAHESELAAAGGEEAPDVWRVDRSIRAPFAERWRLVHHVEGQARRLLPDGDGFDECARREFAIASRADTCALDPRAKRIRKAHPEVPRGGRIDLGERDDVAPDGFRGRRDLDGCQHLAERRVGGCRVDNLPARHDGDHQRDCGAARAGLGQRFAEKAAEHRERNHQGDRHREAHDSLEGDEHKGRGKGAERAQHDCCR